MGRKSLYILIALFTMTLFLGGRPVYCENAMLLNLCQELVSKARGYEARATSHARAAKNFMLHIENTAKLAKNQGTIAAMDNYFARYDQHRSMERKFMDLYRKTASEAKQCMKSVE